jgi:hypothetical protein
MPRFCVDHAENLFLIPLRVKPQPGPRNMASRNLHPSHRYAIFGFDGCHRLRQSFPSGTGNPTSPAASLAGNLASGRLQFHDAGFQPRLSGAELTLDTEQLAVVGYGEYAKADYDLGVQEDVVIREAFVRSAGSARRTEPIPC